jgi:hypothetical protein
VFFPLQVSASGFLFSGTGKVDSAGIECSDGSSHDSAQEMSSFFFSASVAEPLRRFIVRQVHKL